jgi:hypothetical protein
VSNVPFALRGLLGNPLLGQLHHLLLVGAAQRGHGGDQELLVVKKLYGKVRCVMASQYTTL